MQFLEFKELYDSLKDRYSQINSYLDLNQINDKIKSLKDQTLIEGFWDNQKNASGILKQISRFEYDLKSIFSEEFVLMVILICQCRLQ